MKNKLTSMTTWLLIDPARVRMVLLAVMLVLMLAMFLAPGVVYADNQIPGTGH
jgi:hypothetical protein